MALNLPDLMPLPDAPYQFATWLLARVQLDYHIKVGHYYSVSHQLVMRQLGQASGEILVVTLDGNGVPMRPDDLREATGKAAAKREPVDDCADYLIKYRDFLRYNQQPAKNYPIATGVIEGACRYLGKDRMEITWAR